MGKKKGGHNRTRAKKHTIINRKLILKDEQQEYAEVLRMLGGPRLMAFCYDGRERMCKIRGNMVRKVWINKGDIIIIARRGELDQDNKADVIHKFTDEEVRQLKRMGELPSDRDIERMKNPSRGPGVVDDDAQIVFDDV